LAGSQFIHAATGSAGLSLQMINRAKDFQHILTVSVIIKLILGMILIPAYGLLGAALNVFIITIIWKSTTWFILIKRLKAISTSFGTETNV
jgi:O-antigen/teichoic acid export membrane protein